MGVIRVNKTKDYTVMSNHHLKNKELSLKAKGLMSLMLSLPDDWDYSIQGLVAICKESELAIKNSLNELKEHGYLEIIKLMPSETESGRFEYVYNVYEKPIEKNEKQGGGFQPLENQGVENQGVENQEVDNQGQLNTKELNTKESNTKELNTKDIKKERKGTTYDAILDSYHLDPKVRETILEFIKMRKLIKSPMTDHALDLLIRKLADMSQDTQMQVAILEQSIQNSWKGIFPLSNASQRGVTSTQQKVDDWKAWVES